MPATTFFTQRPKRHNDKELQSLLDELEVKTGKIFAVKTDIHKVGFFFKRKVEFTNLYIQLKDMDYQVMQCVRTVGEAKAYCYAYLNNLKRKCKCKN